MTIVLSCNFKGWTAEFIDSALPRIPLPLPFTPQATYERVASDMLDRFPRATIVHATDYNRRCAGCEG